MDNIHLIKEELTNDIIDYSVAFERIKKLPKPWHTKEWNQNRDLLIKDYCEQCNSKSDILVAQHLTHPEKFTSIRRELFQEKLHDYYSVNTIKKPEVFDEDIRIFKENNVKIRNACPNCKQLTFRERKTMQPKYFCQKCKNYFDETVEIEYVEKFKSISMNEQIIEYILIQKFRENKIEIQNKLFKQFEKEISKVALLESIELHIKYVSLENTVTFCKKCASKMDYSNQLLCWYCKENYFYYEIYDNCYQCFENGRNLENPFKQKISDLLHPSIT